MFDDHEDATEFDPTEFDPNPWGARQRLIPRATFIPLPIAPPVEAPPIAGVHATPVRVAYTPAALVAYAASPVAIAQAAARITLRVPALPLHPSTRSLARYAVPVFGFVAVLLLALAYALKPATIAPMQAASIAMPSVVDPLATSVAGVVTETAPTELSKPAPRVPKPRVIAKRRAIKIDASITSSPLGHLRPSRR